jgi:excisionase family DNA binding protein
MKLLDLKAMSQMMSISRMTLYQYIKMGMPHYRIRRKILVNPEEFQEWMQQFRKSQPTVAKDINDLVNGAMCAIKRGRAA